MNIQPLTYTVTMDANLARQVGIPAAMLYNILVWMSQTDLAKDYDEDGWFYLTAKTFEEKTTFNRNTFGAACKKLADKHFIEYQKMYIKGGHTPVNHFRLIARKGDIVCTTNVHGMHNKCANNIKEENKKKNADFTISTKSNEIASPASLGASQPTAARVNTPMESEPFGEEVKRMSVRPNQKDDGGRKRAYAVANNVRKRLGLGGQSTAPYKQLIGRWLECGFTEDDIVEANHLQMNAKDGFHETLSSMARLSADSMDWYQEQKKKQREIPKEYQVETDVEDPELDEDGRPKLIFDRGL